MAQNGRRISIYWVLLFAALLIVSLLATRDNLSKYPSANIVILLLIWGISITLMFIKIRLLRTSLAQLKRVDEDLLARLPEGVESLETTKWGYVAFGSDWIAAVYKPLTTLWVNVDQVDAVIRGCDQWADAKHLRDHINKTPPVRGLPGHWVMLLTDKPGANVLIVPFPSREDSIRFYESVLKKVNRVSIGPRATDSNSILSRRFGVTEWSNLIGSEITSVLCLLAFALLTTFVVGSKRDGSGIMNLWMIAMNPFFFMTIRTEPAGDPLARASADYHGAISKVDDCQVFGPAGGYLYMARRDFVFDPVPLKEIVDIVVTERPLSVWERDVTDKRNRTKTILVLKLNRDHDAELEFDLPAEQAHRICDSVRSELQLG